VRLQKETLLRIPGIRIDNFGNATLHGTSWDARNYFEAVEAMPIGQLKGVNLCELLEWLRWGSEDCVMWECTLPELTRLISQWEKDNPKATPKDFGIPRRHNSLAWMQFWNNFGFAEHTDLARRCRCKTVFSCDQFECPECRKHWTDSGRTAIGPRGERTYDLLLRGHTGYSVCLAAWNSRGTKRFGPDLLDKRWPKMLYFAA
jgi:hypothetical protein